MYWLWVTIGVLLSGLGLGAVAVVMRKYFWHDNTGLPNVTVWNKNRVPFTIVLHEDLVEYTELFDAIENAISWWNEVSGITLFAELGDVGRGDVVVVRPAADQDNPNPYTFYRVVDGEMKSVFVYVPFSLIDIDKATLEFAVAHELGHVLGLDHDDFRSSVMYTHALNDEPELTANDKIFLETVYG